MELLRLKVSKCQPFTSLEFLIYFELGWFDSVNTTWIVQNMREDSDEMFDDLFNKYGKVVFRSNDIKSPTAEVDDDAESLACKWKLLFILQLRMWIFDIWCCYSFAAVAVEMAKVASEVKAGDIKVLFVKPLVYWTRFFIIATAFSRPQIDAIG